MSQPDINPGSTVPANNDNPNDKPSAPRQSRLDKLKTRLLAWIDYVVTGVWSDQRNIFKVNAIKTINLTVRSFFNSDFQGQSAAMTYRTVLAIVPMLAMLFAVCRGFGFENMLTEQLYAYFPSQHKALATAMRFVDSYLAQASEGLFVGVGIIFLLSTVISLLSNVEDAFNTIWHVRNGRTIWRKATDYLGIMLVLPLLIICSSGINIVLDTTLRRLLPFDFMTPVLKVVFEAASIVLTILFFSVSYLLIPNTKVKILNALMAGTLAGTAYLVLQWLFVTGQMYVAKYNAIYGSFSFLPLMLIWLQLVWLFTYIGAEVCYASQNFARFNFQQQIGAISWNYIQKIRVAIMTVIAGRFSDGLPPISADEISNSYNLPLGLVETVVQTLLDNKLIVAVADDKGRSTGRFMPAADLSKLTVAYVIKRLRNNGSANFIGSFEHDFANINTLMNHFDQSLLTDASATLLTDLYAGIPDDSKPSAAKAE